MLDGTQIVTKANSGLGAASDGAKLFFVARLPHTIDSVTRTMVL